jgi:hypothetical protein
VAALGPNLSGELVADAGHRGGGQTSGHHSGGRRAHAAEGSRWTRGGSTQHGRARARQTVGGGGVAGRGRAVTAGHREATRGRAPGAGTDERPRGVECRVRQEVGAGICSHFWKSGVGVDYRIAVLEGVISWLCSSVAS